MELKPTKSKGNRNFPQTTKLLKPVVFDHGSAIFFTIGETFTRAYQHQISLEIMLLLVSIQVFRNVACLKRIRWELDKIQIDDTL